ncbi:thioether cross-link-forming SCIFF peptide maturase [Anaerotignum sp. MSJ-24]|uniref:thioether cross-link-forming SCIFF peptide maturase n=1 Tax=Anaerotignum sp. MSJ-24 TaxID=2841521 RepID=UPI001C117F53|nr:thioether cross-link-forming SCIFF peptide maturase [Anaerotignum sp. MSJ-24]MBU5463895.1 thioether cross-link-forming SCIFF peptide maturase [Anaerotignum sp. MSJ-24]
MLHKFSMNGINVLMDIYSGAVHAVDDVAYDIADLYPEMNADELAEKFADKYSREQIDEAVEELKELKDAGMLYTEDEYEGVLEQVKNRAPVVKALCLHVAHDCNLKCRYCFAEEGEYHGKRSLMSAEVGKKAIDFIIANSGKRRNLEVDFFGGEPLMNFDVVKEIVEYGREQEKLHDKNFRFTITTNGILLDDEKQKYINENMHNVVLSLDGRKEVNDYMRPRAGGQGSYDIIVPKFQKLAESRNQTDYYLRGTFTHNNLDFSKDVFHIADDLGFKQVSVEPVVAEATESYAITEDDLDTIFEEYEKLAEQLYIRHKTGEKDFNFFHFMVDLTGGPCIAKRLSGCGSGTEYLAVTPEGDLYPCHQFVGQEEYKIGSVYNGIENTAIREEFANCNVYTKPDCKKCWAKFYCSGGCMANACHYAGDIMGTYEIGCKLQRKRIECAIMIKAKLMLDELR